MDSLKLMVGQDVSVSLSDGTHTQEGKVIRVGWWTVYVRLECGEVVQFDKQGIERGVDPWSEIGPLHIVVEDFANR